MSLFCKLIDIELSREKLDTENAPVKADELSARPEKLYPISTDVDTFTEYVYKYRICLQKWL